MPKIVTGGDNPQQTVTADNNFSIEESGANASEQNRVERVTSQDSSFSPAGYPNYSKQHSSCCCICWAAIKWKINDTCSFG